MSKSIMMLRIIPRTNISDTIFVVIPEQLHWTEKISDIGDVDFSVSISAKVLSDVIASPSLLDFDSFFPDPFGPYRFWFELYLGQSDDARTGINRMWGLITQASGSWRADSIKVAGKDILHTFERRVFPFDPRPAHVNDFIIGSPDAGQSLKVSAGDTITDILTPILTKVLSITDSEPIGVGSLTPSGLNLDYTLSLGDTTFIKSIIDDLAQNQVADASSNIGGFDYWADPFAGSDFKVGVPKRYGDPATIVAGGAASCILNFDETDPVQIAGVLNVEFTNDGPGGTHVKGFGSGLNGNLGVAIGYDAAQDIYGRIDDPIQFGNVTKASQIAALVRDRLSFDVNPIHEIQVTIDPNALEGTNVSGTSFWNVVYPGMAVYLKFNLDWHQLDSPHQIVSMDCTQNDEGDQTVILGLNQIYDTTGLTGTSEG